MNPVHVAAGRNTKNVVENEKLYCALSSIPTEYILIKGAIRWIFRFPGSMLPASHQE
jgi:hypothetical protein